MGPLLSRILLVVLLIPVLILTAWCGIKIHQLSSTRAGIKKDYSEVNNIQHGLLSVNIWRENITEIVEGQIEAFELNQKHEKLLRQQLDQILHSIVNQAEGIMMEKQKTLGGKIKKAAFKTFVNMDKVRKRIPEFTQTIMNEIKKPESKEKLKLITKEKLNEYAKKTYDSLITETDFKPLLKKYNVSEIEDFNQVTQERIAVLQSKTYTFTYTILASMMVLLLAWLLVLGHKHLYTSLFIVCVVFALILLWLGLSSPMIEIDARIKEMNFLLVGKHLVFNDQVLFYESKSILQVVHILITRGKPDSTLVGFLLLLFSVLFPVLKLLFTKIYLLGKDKWKQYKIVQFFVFKAGKWSMADVMVVAIFMAYIGFKGILDDQLEGMNIKTKSLASIATNQTSLQPGFILFVAYVLFGLLLGVILKRITAKEYRPVIRKGMLKRKKDFDDDL